MASPFTPPTIPGAQGYPLGLTGATAATRYVGATASGAPASGTFSIGDFIIDRSGSVYVCTVAGSPGTWVQAGGGISPTIVDAKGDLIVGTAADTVARLAAGANGTVPTYQSGQTTGLLPQFPPGYELAYVEFTSPVTVASTTEGTPTDIVSAGAVTFDGSVVYVEFYSPVVQTSTGVSTLITCSLWEGSTQLGRMTAVLNSPGVSGTGSPHFGRRKLTPSAGSHTFKIAAHSSGGTNGAVYGGAGGVAAYMPGYIRIVIA